jgi:hypothetical protein
LAAPFVAAGDRCAAAWLGERAAGIVAETGAAGGGVAGTLTVDAALGCGVVTVLDPIQPAAIEPLAETAPSRADRSTRTTVFFMQAD